MGLFSRSTTEDAAAPKRRTNARTTPLSEPSPATQPTPENNLTDTQEVFYSEILTFMRSSEHGQTFTESEEMYLTREQILRFCRATKWDLSKSKARILATLKWRRDYGVDRITAEHIEPEAKTGKQVILGFDKAQRPCLYLFPGRQNTEVSPRQVQYLVWGLERVIDLMPAGVENLALLVNYKGSTGDKNPGIGQGREVLNILQTHYVETLGRALVINIPFFVWGFFKLITPFIDPLTREKLKFNEDMTTHVPVSQLDSEFGGEVVFDYVHEEYWPVLIKMCQEARARKLENWKRAGGGIGISEDLLKQQPSAVAQPATSIGSQGRAIASSSGPNSMPTMNTAQRDSTTTHDNSTGTRLVNQANAETLSSEPVEAVYVPETKDGPKLAELGKELH